MYRQTLFQSSPPPLRELLILTVVLTLGAALTEQLIRQLFGVPGLQTLGTLSWEAVTQHYWLWQLITVPFFYGIPGQGITFSLLIDLTVSCFLLWGLGSMLVDRMGKKLFLLLYFSAALFSSLCALLIMWVTGHHEILAGALPVILAILLLWTLLFPDASLFLFFILPFSPKSILKATLLIVTLVYISQGDLLGWVWSMSGMAVGALFSLFFKVSKRRSKVVNIRTAHWGS